MPEVVAQHVNSEGEELTIERVTDGAFAGQLLLVIHDDPPIGTKAPMLLDKGTIDWLVSKLTGCVRYEHTENGWETTFVEPIPARAGEGGR